MQITVLARRVVSAARPPTRPAAGAPTVHAPGGRRARTPAALQTTIDVSVQNNTGLLDGPVITNLENQTNETGAPLATVVHFSKHTLATLSLYCDSSLIQTADPVCDSSGQFNSIIYRLSSKCVALLAANCRSNSSNAS